ncbi:MAG TPA: hypothetical protein VHG91_15610 [Longimicrobium sp.]|nr:hypothetical protein [Longimicrobium sp.]
MRRAQLQSAVEEVLENLRECGLREALAAMLRAQSREPGADPTTLAVLEALRAYAIGASRYSPAAKRIAGVVGLDRLEGVDLWARLFVPEGRGALTQEIFAAVRFVSRHLPRLLAILSEGPHALVEEVRRGGAEALPGTGVLTVIVLEPEERYSTAQRLITMLQAVEGLYEACAVLTGVSSQGLSVVACDSGDEKSFDLLGAAPAVEALRALIRSMWDRLVYHRDLPIAHRYRAVVNSLPVLGRIREMEAEGTFAREQAEKLRRQIGEGAGKFLVSGAIIPDLGDHAYHDPRVLMAPAPKLIGPPLRAADEPPPPRPGASAAAGAAGSLSAQERETLRQLLRKVREQSEPAAPN